MLLIFLLVYTVLLVRVDIFFLHVAFTCDVYWCANLISYDNAIYLFFLGFGVDLTRWLTQSSYV